MNKVKPVFGLYSSNDQEDNLDLESKAEYYGKKATLLNLVFRYRRTILFAIAVAGICIASGGFAAPFAFLGLLVSKLAVAKVAVTYLSSLSVVASTLSSVAIYIVSTTLVVNAYKLFKSIINRCVFTPIYRHLAKKKIQEQTLSLAEHKDDKHANSKGAVNIKSMNTALINVSGIDVNFLELGSGHKRAIFLAQRFINDLKSGNDLDVICLQEVFQPNLSIMMRELAHAGLHVWSPDGMLKKERRKNSSSWWRAAKQVLPNWGSSMGSGILYVSKHEIIRKVVSPFNQGKYSETRGTGDEGLADKSFSAIIIKKQNKKILISSNHLQAGPGMLKKTKQTREGNTVGTGEIRDKQLGHIYREINNIMEDEKDIDRAAIVGDFNTGFAGLHKIFGASKFEFRKFMGRLLQETGFNLQNFDSNESEFNASFSSVVASRVLSPSNASSETLNTELLEASAYKYFTKVKEQEQWLRDNKEGSAQPLLQKVRAQLYYKAFVEPDAEIADEKSNNIDLVVKYPDKAFICGGLVKAGANTSKIQFVRPENLDDRVGSVTIKCVHEAIIKGEHKEKSETPARMYSTLDPSTEKMKLIDGVFIFKSANSPQPKSAIEWRDPEIERLTDHHALTTTF